MPPPYLNPTEASTALTSAFGPTTQAQRDAIAHASSLVPTITATSIAPATPYNLTPPTPDTNPYQQMVAGGNAQVKSYATDSTATDAPTTPESDLQTFINSYRVNDNQSSDFATFIGKTPEQIASEQSIAEADTLGRRRAVRAAQAELSGVQAELQSIVDTGKAQYLKLEQNATGGLITTEFL